jgi:hypothetical protein
MRLLCKKLLGPTRILLLFVLLSALTGCGAVRISGAINQSSVSVVNGTVSFVQFTAIFDSNNSLINVTIVSLFVPPSSQTFTFCNNQVSQFTMNSPVQVSFISRQPCSSLVAVVAH